MMFLRKKIGFTAQNKNTNVLKHSQHLHLHQLLLATLNNRSGSRVVSSLTMEHHKSSHHPKSSAAAKSDMPDPTASGTKKKSRASISGKNIKLPVEIVDFLKAWIMSPEHIHHPYPSEDEKRNIMASTGLELKQLNNWFVNNRKRYWKPRVKSMAKEADQGRRDPRSPEQKNTKRKRVAFVESDRPAELLDTATSEQDVVEFLFQACSSSFPFFDFSTDDLTIDAFASSEGEDENKQQAAKHAV